jgi:hypothetical protein
LVIAATIYDLFKIFKKHLIKQKPVTQPVNNVDHSVNSNINEMQVSDEITNADRRKEANGHAIVEKSKKEPGNLDS